MRFANNARFIIVFWDRFEVQINRDVFTRFWKVYESSSFGGRMKMQLPPSLAQVGEAFGEPASCLQYVCDPKSGLLHIGSDVTPAIERILSGSGDQDAIPSTIVTRKPADDRDPDIIRSLSNNRFSELDTDVLKRAPDPDIIKIARYADARFR